MSGRLASESVAGLRRNQRPAWLGLRTAEPGRFAHLAAITPARDIAAALLAFALRAKLGLEVHAGLCFQPLDLSTVTIGPLTLRRAAPQPLAIEDLAATGALDQEAMRPNGQAIPTLVVLVMVGWIIGREAAGIVQFATVVGAEPAGNIAIRPMVVVRQET
jgi:hypothetical protein